MVTVKNVETAEFEEAVLRRSFDTPVLVDFWAEWCGPCKVLGPILERVAAEYVGQMELVKIDSDANQQLAQHFEVQGIPTVIAFKDGAPVDRFTGAIPEAQVRQFLERFIPSPLDMQAAAAELAWENGDDAGAEVIFREIIGSDPSHQVAGLGLAGILFERNAGDEALAVLARLAPTAEVRQLQAAIRLGGGEEDIATLESADLDDPGTRLRLARALAAAERYDEALDHLLELVSMRLEDLSEQARLIVLDLFELLGPDEPLTQTYRRRLASALF